MPYAGWTLSKRICPGSGMSTKQRMVRLYEGRPVYSCPMCGLFYRVDRAGHMRNHRDPQYLPGGERRRRAHLFEFLYGQKTAPGRGAGER